MKFKNPFKLPENTDNNNTKPEQEKTILSKFRGISRKYATRAMAILAFGLATKKMRGQINPEYATGKYNTIKTIVDYNGPKSDIETQYHDNDASTQASWAQSVQTECLNPQTQINEYANVPSSVLEPGDLSSTSTNYRAWVEGVGSYAGNGRPDSADDRRGYVYQLQVNSDMMGYTWGNGTSYSTAAYDVRALDPVQSDGIMGTHEIFGHGLGLYHTDATTFTMEVDYQQNESFNYTETAKTVMSAGDTNGQYSPLMTCSVNYRTDIASDGYVYSTLYSTLARTLPANLDNSTSGDRSLDKLHNRLKIGGVLHDRVYEETVPTDQKIENIPFNYTINGTVLTVQNFAGFNALTNPNNELPEDCQVFVYNANDTAEGHQIARFPAPRSNRIGWRWDEYGQIDFADFLAQHGGNLSDYAFRIRATHQNQMGPAGVEQATNTPPETSNSSVSVNEDETYIFASSDFPYSDVEGTPMAKIKIPTLPTHGTLELNGTPITANQEIPANEISNLTYTPNANYNGTDTFPFSASDGTDWSTPDTMTVNINAVNDAPETFNSSVSVNEDETYIFASSDFPYSDVESTPLAKIKIPTLPTHGTLKLNGTPITANQEIPANEISNLTYTPNANYNGTDAFTFSASDGTDWSTPDTMTVTINAVNDAPSAPTVTISNITQTSFTATSDGSTDNVGVVGTEFYLDNNLIYTDTTGNQPVSYDFTGLSIGSDHTVKTRTFDNAGNFSPFSSAENVTTGINDEKIAGLRFYPNPVKNALHISLENSNLKAYEIFDLTGKKIDSQAYFTPQPDNAIDVRRLSPGLYIIRLSDDQNQTGVLKFVKE